MCKKKDKKKPSLEEIRKWLDENSGGPTDEEFAAYMERERKRPIKIRDKRGNIIEEITFE